MSTAEVGDKDLNEKLQTSTPSICMYICVYISTIQVLMYIWMISMNNSTVPIRLLREILEMLFKECRKYIMHFATHCHLADAETWNGWIIGGCDKKYTKLATVRQLTNHFECSTSSLDINMCAKLHMYIRPQCIQWIKCFTALLQEIHWNAITYEYFSLTNEIQNQEKM